jgi:hypothetical protein
MGIQNSQHSYIEDSLIEDSLIEDSLIEDSLVRKILNSTEEFNGISARKTFNDKPFYSRDLYKAKFLKVIKRENSIISIYSVQYGKDFEKSTKINIKVSNKNFTHKEEAERTKQNWISMSKFTPRLYYCDFVVAPFKEWILNGGYQLCIATEHYDNVLSNISMYDEAIEQLESIYKGLYDNDLFCYDIKPDNIVVKKGDDDKYDELKIIDLEDCMKIDTKKLQSDDVIFFSKICMILQIDKLRIEGKNTFVPKKMLSDLIETWQKNKETDWEVIYLELDKTFDFSRYILYYFLHDYFFEYLRDSHRSLLDDIKELVEKYNNKIYEDCPENEDCITQDEIEKLKRMVFECLKIMISIFISKLKDKKRKKLGQNSEESRKRIRPMPSQVDEKTMGGNKRLKNKNSKKKERIRKKKRKDSKKKRKGFEKKKERV